MQKQIINFFKYTTLDSSLTYANWPITACSIIPPIHYTKIRVKLKADSMI